MNMSKAQQQLMMEWKDIPWKTIQRKAFKLHASNLQSGYGG
jgi:hypothetical protein